MDRRALLVRLTVLVLLLVPSVHAAPGSPVAADLHATGYALEASEGVVRVGSHAHSASLPSVGFRLEAERVVVEYQNTTRVEGGGVLPEYTISSPESRLATYQDVVALEVAARPNREVAALVDGDAVVRVEGGEALLGSSAVPEFEVNKRVRSGSDPGNVSSVGLVRAMPGVGSSVVVRGDFIVALWEIDVDLRTPDRAVALRTGQFADGQTVSATGSGVYDYREVLLYVTGGVLRLDPSFETADNLVAELADVVVLRDPVLHAATVHLGGVVGPLPILGGETDGGDLELAGDLRLDLRAADAVGPDGSPLPFSWGLGGRVDAATLDGTPLSINAPLAGPAVVRDWLPVLAPLLLVGLLVVGGPLRVRGAKRRLADAELLFASGHFDAAAHAAAGAIALRHRAVTPMATALRVQALLHAGRVAEARRLAADPALDHGDPILRRLVHATVRDWGDA